MQNENNLHDLTDRMAILEQDLSSQKARLAKMEEAVTEMIREVRGDFRAAVAQMQHSLGQVQTTVTHEIQSIMARHELAERVHWDSIEQARMDRADDERRYKTNTYVSLAGVFVALVAILATLWVGRG